MTRERYMRLAEPFQKHPALLRALRGTDKVLTALVYLAYPVLLCVLFFTRDTRFWRCVLVPGVSFAVVSVLRRLINAKRPYEALKFQPLLQKDKRGESFPSRHVFSVFVIAFAFYYTFVPAGIVLTVLGVLLAVVRVVGGVHFPRDVLCGAAIGMLCGAVGFFLL